MSNNSMTPEEVAIALNITKNTVYEMVKRGELKSYRIGRKIRIDEKELSAYKSKMENSDVYSEKKESDTFIISGQDIILDILSRYIEKLNLNTKILRSHKGSYNGLYDLYNDKVNVATTHLWDAESDTYNISYVKSMLPGIKTTIINLAKRQQGFYVKTGNPKNITAWKDLKREDIKIVNREKGSGTRVLLDEHLKLLDISPKEVDGYDFIATSHLSVASSVARGFGDFGLGNEKAAKQINGIEFVPLQKENYDLVIKDYDLNLPIVQDMLKILSSEDFKNEVRALGDYDID